MNEWILTRCFCILALIRCASPFHQPASEVHGFEYDGYDDEEDEKLNNVPPSTTADEDQPVVSVKGGGAGGGTRLAGSTSNGGGVADSEEQLASAVLHWADVVDASSPDTCNRSSLLHLKHDFSKSAELNFPRPLTAPARQTAALLTSVLTSRPLPDRIVIPSTAQAYFAISRVLLQGSPNATAAGVAFAKGKFEMVVADPSDNVGVGGDRTRLFAPFAFRRSVDGADGNEVSTERQNFNGESEEIDLAQKWSAVFGQEEGLLSDWLGPLLSERGGGDAHAINNNKSSLRRGPTPKLPLPHHPPSSVVQGFWTRPFYDCGGSNKWLIGYSVPFFEGTTDSKQLKGVVVLLFDLSNVDVNQCAQDDSWFANTHRCERNTMQCQPILGQGFRGGSYTCICSRSFYLPAVGGHLNGTFGRWPGVWSEEEEEKGAWRCLPCRPGCDHCTSDDPCFVEYDVFLRGLPLGVQSFCMTITLVLMVAVFRLRKSMTVAAGMWTMLEMILLGAICLYATVVCRYFEPTTISCLLEPWFRELGFATCYGAIVLKIYRILVEFRTRKAHRWVVRDKDLLKYLAAILLVVGGYMAAWTAINMHLLKDGHTLLSEGHTPQGLRYFICRSVWWEYVTEIGELLFLLFGVYLSYHVRNASSDFKEKRYLCLAIFIELFVSVGLHGMRHVVWLDLDPDVIFLMYFGRCQLTVTIILILIFAPKLWYYHRPPRDPLDPEHRGGDHGPHETVKLQDGVTSNGEVDISDINLADMDPEDIRAELRRVYTQLQILRNKTMRKDNPHISKRRGGRKATHRRFSLQAFHHRHRQATHHEQPEHEADGSKTPEESTASVDGAPLAPTDIAAATASSAMAATPTTTFTVTMAAANPEVTTAAAVAVPTVTFKGMPK